MAAKFPLQAAYQVGISAKLPVELAAKALTQPWLTMKIFQPGSYLSKAPEHYKKFYWDWKRAPRTPVHYIPETANWKKLPTGEVQQVEDLPIPLMEPKELHQGIWGGEAVIKGFRKRKETIRRTPRFWVPTLQSTVFYSEILDKHINVVVTKRTLRLVDEHYGFDNYILKTPPADLMSELALKIRREMYLALARGTLYPDNPSKREEVLEKYREYMIPEEEAEWFGLNIKEAIIKLKILEEDVKPVPLKHAFRKEFLEYLKNNKEEILEEEKEKSSSSSWLASVNPFAKKE
ncbi:large ribosomal subunit protein bL28m-like [Macrobrachium nipponense]|uniref:large ribosomal subunit protein bL28m-like n=1 Tax=Macrobrachium nipponense TaxID=159736 RepID=UPI0030C7FF44